MMVYLILIFAFIIGAAVGSFLNVCIYRIPREKSILWPGSHCGNCWQAIRWYDNIPLVSYWLLRGRCRSCGCSYSLRYFVIELFTGACFAGLFYLEAVQNVHHLKVFDGVRGEHLLIPAAGWGFLIFHAVLVSFLIVVSFCDIDTLEIPFSITLTGTLVGLIGGAILWSSLEATAISRGPPVHLWTRVETGGGVYPWPLWLTPLPSWLAWPGWWTGLATGLAGTLAGMLALRGVRFVFQLGRGIEGMGIGDADVMMMAGSFLGWQPVILAFFIGVFVALFFGIGQLILRGNQMMPFGPALGIGVVITMLCWQSIGPNFASIFFDETVMLYLFALGGGLLLVISFAIRLVRRG